jgi:hypothetical protein
VGIKNMGQYYKAVNLDKKEFVKPHDCGEGAKLMEFGLSGMGLMSCLAILLADGNNRGGGDLRSDNPLIGSWAGDRVVITGDYADDGKFVPEGTVITDHDGDEHDAEHINLYTLANEEHGFKNISADAMRALCEDSYVRGCLERNAEEHPFLADRYKNFLGNTA